MVALCLGSGIYGSSLGQHVTQSGFFDEGSESAQASRLGDEHYGRDTSSHIVAIYTAPDGKTVDDPAFRKKVLDSLAQVEEDHPDQVLRSIGYFKTPDLLRNMSDASKKHAFMSIQLKGDNDDHILKNYKAIQEDLSDPGVDIQLAGLLPLANELTGTIATDQQRAEVLAMPLVVVLLFFVFGGVIAAFLPGIIGGLTIAGALGIMRLTALSVPVHYFAQPVVTLIGLGIAIDYGLFVVSRFREELAEGYDTETAVRRTVVTAGRTIAFSSVLISASVGGLLLFPQGFLKSLTYAMIASVTLGGHPVDHGAARDPGDARPERRRPDCADAAANSVPAQQRKDQPADQLAGRQASENQDERGGRERVLGQAGRPRDETACHVRGSHPARVDHSDPSAWATSRSAASAKSTCRQPIRCARRRRTSTGHSPDSASSRSRW